MCTLLQKNNLKEIWSYLLKYFLNWWSCMLVSLLPLNKSLIYRMIPFVPHSTTEFSSASAYGTCAERWTNRKLNLTSSRATSNSLCSLSSWLGLNKWQSMGFFSRLWATFLFLMFIFVSAGGIWSIRQVNWKPTLIIKKMWEIAGGWNIRLGLWD